MALDDRFPPALLTMLVSNASVDPACVGQPPTSEEMIASMDVAAMALYGGLTLLASLCVVVYAEEVVYLRRKIRCRYRTNTLVWINGAPPVIAVTACIGLWVPRAAMFTDYTASIYFAICIHQFMLMMIQDYGGEEELISRFRGTHISISTGPCCCCCICLPRVELTRRSVCVIQFGSFQVAFLRPLLLFLGAVLWTNGTYTPDNMSVRGSYLWISCLSGAATIVSLWAIGVVFGHARTHLPHVNIAPKFALNQMILILSSLQLVILASLGSSGSVACVPPFPSRARAVSMHLQLLVVEMFVVALVSRALYRRQYQHQDQDHRRHQQLDRQDTGVTVEGPKAGAAGGGGGDGGGETTAKHTIMVRT